MTEDTTRTHRATSTVPITGMTCTACERRVSPGPPPTSRRRGRGGLRRPGARRRPHGADLPTRARIDAAIRAAGYEPAAPRWLTRTGRPGRPCSSPRCAIAWIAWVADAVRPRQQPLRPHRRLERRPARRPDAGPHRRRLHLHGHGRRPRPRHLRLARSQARRGRDGTSRRSRIACARTSPSTSGASSASACSGRSSD